MITVKPTRVLIASLFLMLSASALANFTATPSEARKIAKEAYLYGFPVVEMYKTLYTQAVDQTSSNFKAPFNQIGNTAKVFTPEDSAFVTPNSDTPYSFVWMDLRSEPLVLTMPPIEDSRYYSVQLVDLYTHNFAYLGTRSTGNKGGHFMVAGPDWKGPKPSNVDQVIHSESNIAYALYRTQLFDEKDLSKVQQIQQRYKVDPLSKYSRQPAPNPATQVNWPKPVANMSDSPALFRYLNFMLAFAPAQPVEKEVLERFATIGIAAGEPFDVSELKVEQRQALEAGIADGKAEFAEFKKNRIDTHKVTSGDFFGTREHLNGNYLYRYVGANIGIFGNSSEEANYIGYFVDNQGKPVDTSKQNYTLRFDKGALPPANAFWSLTMYDGKSKLLVANPLNRYLINSRMIPDLKLDADGGLTLYVQHARPDQDKQSNWLPAPSGPFYGVLRIYLPKPEVTNGEWKMPHLMPVSQ